MIFLDGSNCGTIDNNIDGDVTHFKIDPYHGFAFWIEDDTKLMQLELGCSSLVPPPQIQVLLEMNNHKLGDFVVLFDQFKLQIADLTDNHLLELDIIRSSQKTERVK